MVKKDEKEAKAKAAQISGGNFINVPDQSDSGGAGGSEPNMSVDPSQSGEPNQSIPAGPDDPNISTPGVEYGPTPPTGPAEEPGLESEGIGPLGPLIGGVEGAAEGLGGIVAGVAKEYLADKIIEKAPDVPGALGYGNERPDAGVADANPPGGVPEKPKP